MKVSDTLTVCYRETDHHPKEQNPHRADALMTEFLQMLQMNHPLK